MAQINAKACSAAVSKLFCNVFKLASSLLISTLFKAESAFVSSVVSLRARATARPWNIFPRRACASSSESCKTQRKKEDTSTSRTSTTTSAPFSPSRASATFSNSCKQQQGWERKQYWTRTARTCCDNSVSYGRHSKSCPAKPMTYSAKPCANRASTSRPSSAA